MQREEVISGQGQMSVITGNLPANDSFEDSRPDTEFQI